MATVTVMDGIIVGSAGGAIAGLTVYLVQYLHNKVKNWDESRRIYYKWLTENTSDNTNERYRSTRAIASWNNVTEDRARYLCSIYEGIYLSTGQKEDMWSIYVRSSEDRSDEGPQVRGL